VLTRAYPICIVCSQSPIYPLFYLGKFQPVFQTQRMPGDAPKIKHETLLASAEANRPDKRAIIRTMGRSKDWAGNAGGQAGSHIVITRGRRLWR
jgi:hypothetical protein